MPFYISSCLFTSYVLYVCLRGLHMCHMWLRLRLCSYACVSSSHSANYPMQHHCSFHFLIICENKFNHLATYKYYTYIFQWMWLFFSVILFRCWTKYTGIAHYNVGSWLIHFIPRLLAERMQYCNNHLSFSFFLFTHTWPYGLRWMLQVCVSLVVPACIARKFNIILNYIRLLIFARHFEKCQK